MRAGWIERRDSTADARAYRHFVARKAEPLIEKLAAMAEMLRGEFMAGISPARREAMVADLLHIKSNLLRMNVNAR